MNGYRTEGRPACATTRCTEGRPARACGRPASRRVTRSPDGETETIEVRCDSPIDRLVDEELVVLSRAGCREATEHLLRKYRGLVESKARTFFLAGAERDDVIQEGMIGLFKAIRDFRAEKMVAFRHFAETCVTRQIITATKTATRKKHRVLSASLSLDAPGDDSSTDALETPWPGVRCASSPEQIVLGRHVAHEIDSRMRSALSQLECIALSAYVAGRSYHEIAEKLRMSPKQIDNALQRAKRKMKEKLTRAIHRWDTA
jgi:RNA polymerase sporulation-specific sigma factor